MAALTFGRTLAAGLPALAMLITAAGAAAQTSDKPMNYRTIFREREKLDGQVITVRGYIEGCNASRCLLYQDRRHAAQRSPYALSVGPAEAFEREVRERVRGEVTVRARVDSSCMNRPPAWARDCPTRPATLNDVEIVRWG